MQPTTPMHKWSLLYSTNLIKNKRRIHSETQLGDSNICVLFKCFVCAWYTNTLHIYLLLKKTRPNFQYPVWATSLHILLNNQWAVSSGKLHLIGQSFFVFFFFIKVANPILDCSKNGEKEGRADSIWAQENFLFTILSYTGCKWCVYSLEREKWKPGFPWALGENATACTLYASACALSLNPGPCPYLTVQ